MMLKVAWFEAIKHRDYSAVRLNIDKYKRVRDDLGWTGLMYASWANDMELVRLLANDERNLTNGQGYTATIIAALNGSVDACQYLLTKEEIGLTEFGHTPLTIAAAEGVTSTIRVLIPYYGTMKDSMGWTPLDHAASNGHIDVVKLLIDDLSPRARSLTSSIEKAIASGNKHIVELLTLCRDSIREQSCVTCSYYRNLYISSISTKAEGQNVEERFSERKPTGMVADAAHIINMDISLGRMEWNNVIYAFNIRLERIRETRERLATLDGYLSSLIALWTTTNDAQLDHSGVTLQGTTPLMIAAAGGDAGRVRAHITKYSGKKNSLGLTALMLAARKGHLDCVELLLSEASQVDHDGYTALMHAVMANMHKVVEFLTEHEGCMHCSRGDTALILAAQLGKMTVPVSLIEKEAKLRDKNGVTALIYSILNRDDVLANQLIPYEASIQDSDGITALMAAAYINNTGLIAKLIPTERRKKTVGGFTALMVAGCLNNKEAVEILISQESFCVTNNLFSALILAIICNSIEAVRALGLVELSILSPHGYNAIELSSSGPCYSIISDICDGIKVSS